MKNQVLCNRNEIDWVTLNRLHLKIGNAINSPWFLSISSIQFLFAASVLPVLTVIHLIQTYSYSVKESMKISMNPVARYYTRDSLKIWINLNKIRTDDGQSVNINSTDENQNEFYGNFLAIIALNAMSIWQVQV